MAIINIKNDKGEFVEVPVIKGDNGGYYIPTISGSTIEWVASSPNMPTIGPSEIFADGGAVILTNENYAQYITNGDEVSY
jgi:hypothetical protein